jgi:hypothetical protein
MRAPPIVIVVVPRTDGLSAAMLGMVIVMVAVDALLPAL